MRLSSFPNKGHFSERDSGRSKPLPSNARSASATCKACGAHGPKGMPVVQVLTVNLSERINEVPECRQECYPVSAVKRQLAGFKRSGSLRFYAHLSVG